jgi:hypothetical protein
MIKVPNLRVMQLAEDSAILFDFLCYWRAMIPEMFGLKQKVLVTVIARLPN